MSPLAAWGVLGVAIAFEVAGTAMLKMANGFARPAWFFASIAAYCVCFAILSFVFKYIPLSIAYAVWGGAGAVLIVAVDYYVFGHTLSPLQIALIAVIILGVIGLKLTT